jgi:hypothetical protein
MALLATWFYKIMNHHVGFPQHGCMHGLCMHALPPAFTSFKKFKSFGTRHTPHKVQIQKRKIRAQGFAAGDRICYTDHGNGQVGRAGDVDGPLQP